MKTLTKSMSLPSLMKKRGSASDNSASNQESTLSPSSVKKQHRLKKTSQNAVIDDLDVIPKQNNNDSMVDSVSSSTKQRDDDIPTKKHIRFSEDNNTNIISAESTTPDNAAATTEIAPQDNPDSILSPSLKRNNTVNEINNERMISIEVDNGELSDNPHHDLIRVLRMVATERHLTANELYRQVMSRLRHQQMRKRQRGGEEDPNFEFARKYHEENRREFEQLEKRALLFTRAKRNLAIDDDWIKAQTLFGITTYYRREADKSLSIKMEGDLHGVPIFEQLAVLKEIDLYHTWAPFCSDSKCIAALTKTDTIGYIMAGLPSFGIYRDACFRAVACDSMNEDGSIIIVAESIGPTSSAPKEKQPGLPETKEEKEEEEKSQLQENLTGGYQEHENLLLNSSLRASSIRSKKSTVSDTDVIQNGFIEQKIHGEEEEKDQLDDYEYNNNESNRGWSEYFSTRLNSSLSLEAEDIEDDYNLASSFLAEDEVLKSIQLPPLPTGYGAARMIIRRFEAEIDVLSPTSARTRLVSNVDPNIALLPKWLLDFILKKMCGVLLNRLQSAARKTLKDPLSPHARRMREDSEFYRYWLWQKFAKYCDDLGWEMPSVRAFEVKEDEIDIDEWMEYNSKNNRSVSSTGHVQDFDTIQSTPTFKSSFSHKSTQSSKTGWFSMTPKEWEARTEEKRIRKIASARRKAQLMMKPKELSPEKERRLQALKEAKLRFEKKTYNNSDFSDTGTVSTLHSSHTKTSRRSSNSSRYSKNQTSATKSSPSRLGIFLNIISGAHTKILPWMILPFLLPSMFLIFNKCSKGLNNILLRNYENDVVDLDPSQDEIVDYIPTSLIILVVTSVYNLLFWSVTCSIFVWAFDAIEIPGLLGEYKPNMIQIRKFYIQQLQVYVAYSSMAVSTLAFARALFAILFRNLCIFVLANWGKVVDRWHIWFMMFRNHMMMFRNHMNEQNFIVTQMEIILSRTKNAILILSENKAIMFLWKIIYGQGKKAPIDVLKRVNVMRNAFMQHDLVRLFCHLTSLLVWSISVGSRYLLHFIKLFIISQVESTPQPWIIDAMGYMKSFMTYISLFLLTMLVVSLVLIPKRKKPSKPVNSSANNNRIELSSIPETIPLPNSEVLEMPPLTADPSHDDRSLITMDDTRASNSSQRSTKSLGRRFKRKISKRLRFKSTRSSQNSNTSVGADQNHDDHSKQESFVSEITQETNRSTTKKKFRSPFGRRKERSN